MSDIKQTNPLLDYSRREIVFLNLPSAGEDGKSIGVKPMTAKDELLFKTPDALLNGESITKVLISCCMGITDPYKMPINDVDALLLAVRLASYGEEMDVTLICSECETENLFEAPIRQCLDNMEFLDSVNNVTVSETSGGFKVSIRPYTFKQSVDESLKQFNESKALSYLISDDEEMSLKDQKNYNDAITRIANFNISLLAESIIEMHDTDGNKIDVTKENIETWVEDLPLKDANLIIDEIKRINSIGIKKDIHAICQNSECGHEWDAELSFDPSYFFGKGS